MTDPTGGTTTYVYDLDGELTSVTDPNGNTVTYSYNTLGLVVGRVGAWQVTGDSEVSVATYTYDADGDLLHATDGDGAHDSYTYNGLNELTSSPTPTATPPRTPTTAMATS